MAPPFPTTDGQFMQEMSVKFLSFYLLYIARGTNSGHWTITINISEKKCTLSKVLV